MDRATGKFTHYIHSSNKNSLSQNSVKCMFETQADILWIGTESGLNRFDINENIFTHYNYEVSDRYSISDNAIYSIFADREGGMWIGTYFGGSKLFPQTP